MTLTFSLGSRGLSSGRCVAGKAESLLTFNRSLFRRYRNQMGISRALDWKRRCVTFSLDLRYRIVLPTLRFIYL